MLGSVGVARFGACMHSWRKSEAPLLKTLLTRSEADNATMTNVPVTNHSEELCCGWKPARPRAEYDITRPSKKQQRRPLGTLPPAQPLAQGTTTYGVAHAYMSGKLDENYDYTYKGGLSSRAYSESPMHPIRATHPPPPHPHTFVLDPVLPYRRTLDMDTSSRAQLEHILAMQMKPELLVEQLIIENRLRTMSLNAFPTLECIGFDGRKDKTRRNEYKLPTKSFSSPAINSQHDGIFSMPQHRKHRRRKPHPKPPIEWCAFPNPPAHRQGREFPAFVLPFDTTRKQRQGFQGLVSTTSLPKLTLSKSKHKLAGGNDRQLQGGDDSTGGAAGGQVQYALPVVAPELGAIGNLKESGKVKQSKLKPAQFPPNFSGGD